MRILFIILLAFFTFQKSHSQKTTYLDVDRNEITKNEYQNKWRNTELFLTRWDSIGKDNKRYTILKKDLYLTGTFNYTEIKNQLEEITNRKISDSVTFLIEYFYKDDLCSSFWDNNWDISEVSWRKDFTNPLRKKVEKSNIVYFVLFETGMTIKNRPNNKKGYFFIDEGNYFKKKLFKSPTLCGSYALIKPNGQILIRNGEYRADNMAEHLNPDVWNLFFETED